LIFQNGTSRWGGEALENKNDYQFKLVFDIIKDLIKEEEKPKKKIGFHT
jgi:hypothetical protein